MDNIVFGMVLIRNIPYQHMIKFLHLYKTHQKHAIPGFMTDIDFRIALISITTMKRISMHHVRTRANRKLSVRGCQILEHSA